MSPHSDRPPPDDPLVALTGQTYRTVLPGSDGYPIDLDNFDALLTACLDRLAVVGPMPEPSQLQSLLPDVDPSTQNFILIELVKMDMALSAQQGSLRRVETYCDALCEFLSVDSIPFDLLLEEFQLRKEMGDPPAVDEVAKRFPRFVSVLGQLSSRCEATVAERELRPLPDLSQHGRVDDFLLLQELGRGAFATVYLAKQMSMQRLVALKISRGKGQESQALAQFDHANIVRVFDQRSLPDQQLHLLYMQFHPGGTLADVVSLVKKENGVITGSLLLDSVDRKLLLTSQSVPDNSSTRAMIAGSGWPTVVAWVGTQLANALTEAHAHGVVHRDVKPANVLLSAEGVPKLADFNVSFAGVAGRAGAAATFGGSIGYMSPEHLTAIQNANPQSQSTVNEASDLYSLAVLLWELWQGERPFNVPSRTSSWSEAIASQLSARDLDFQPPRRTGDASERVLEKVLRQTLSSNPNQRPASGAELAGRLKLALHPKAAEVFDVMASPKRSWIMRRSPWIVATAIILAPNVVGGVLNYQYNFHEVVTKGIMQDGLKMVSWYTNLTLFPLGAALIIYFAISVIHAVQAAQAGELASPKDIDDTLGLGNRAAIIGGTLWLIGGAVFPVSLSMMYADFTLMQAVHFMLSSIICGAIAMIYPFFAMALLATLVYYPFFLAGSMIDVTFQKRASRIIKQSEIYLLVAALIPFLAVALLILNETTERVFMFVAVAAGSIGLVASFFTHRILQKWWAKMGEVLE